MGKVEQIAAKAAYEFFARKEAHDRAAKEFEEHKKLFYASMDDFFSGNGGSTVTFHEDGLIDGQLVVRKVSKTIIDWDADKLERKIGRIAAKKVIKKQYRIQDMKGLTQYLRECGVDPKIFKRFILVDRTVDVKAIDQMGDVGELTVNQIKGCYTVKTSKPYYTVSVQKDIGDGEQ